MQKLKKNDQVVVLSGKEKGKTGKVLRINWNRNLVFVEGLNTVVRATKPNQANPSGGFVQKEGGIHLSAVSLVSPKTGKATRVRVEKRGDKVVRVGVRCGSVF